MFITRKRFEQELRRAEAKGRKEQRRKMEVERRMNVINTDMSNYCRNIEKACDILRNRIERIENYVGMRTSEKVN